MSKSASSSPTLSIHHLFLLLSRPCRPEKLFKSWAKTPRLTRLPSRSPTTGRSEVLLRTVTRWMKMRKTDVQVSSVLTVSTSQAECCCCLLTTRISAQLAVIVPVISHSRTSLLPLSVICSIDTPTMSAHTALYASVHYRGIRQESCYGLRASAVSPGATVRLYGFGCAGLRV
jgi:hypothetical protein